MGKGNRNRNDRYEDVYSMSGAGAAVNKTPRAAAKKDNTTTILITVIAVLLLASLAIFIFSSSGIVERSTVYVSSENFEVTGTMLPYYENLAYSSTFEQYYMLYYNYVYQGDAAQAYTAVANMMSGYTLNDFFDSAIATSKEMVALAEEAVKNGVKLDDEELASIETTLKNSSAASLGRGVNKKDLRAALELQALASKYAKLVDEDIKNTATKEDILAFVNENKADFYKIDALKFVFSLKAADYADDGVAYATAEKLVDLYAAKLLGTTTPADYKKVLIEYVVERDFDKLMDENKGTLEAPDAELAKSVKAALAENLFQTVVNGEIFVSSVTDNATYAETVEKVASKLLATCTSAIGNLTVTESYTVAADDEILSWLSNEETKENETKMKAESTDSEYSKTVYMVTKPMYLDERETKDVAHILIKAEEKATDEVKAAAKEKADKVLAEYLAGEKTLDAFKKLAETYNEDSGSVYEGVYPGQMVKAFEEWCFDEARVEGDTGIVQTEYGYHIMYFIGDGEVVYYNNAMASYADEKYSDLIKDLTKEHVVLNDKAIAKKTSETVPPETTKAPETTEAAA